MKKLEDFELAEDENFAAMFEESEKSTQTNTVTDGEVVAINDENFIVSIGGKEGRIPLSEITAGGEVKYKVGDTITVMVVGTRGENLSLSYKKVLQKAKFDEFFAQHGEEPENLIVEGVVTFVKPRAGFIVESEDGMEFFMPMAQGYLKAFGAVGKKIKAVVLKAKKETSSIVISRKKLIEDFQKNKEELISKLMETKEPKIGTIKKITSYGMFVDMGGVDGLVNYNEISYKGPVNPSQYYEEGDKVEVVVKSYNKDKGHLSLSIKDAMPNPWEEVEEQLEVGDTITVTVSNFESYGAFVDLGNDIEGLLHISEISWSKNVKNPKDYLTIGDEINVEVIDLDCVKRKLRVSLKSLLPKPFKKFVENTKVGDTVKGTVATLTEFGAFISIGEVDGLLHNEEASWEANVKCKNVYKKGDEVEVKVIKIDREKENISLSIKAMGESPADKFAATHAYGDIIKSTVKDIKDFGVFVVLENNLDGLIRKEDLLQVAEGESEVAIGDEIEAVIVNIDKQNNRVRLSVKRLESQQNRDVMKAVSDDSAMTLGDALA
ncbi:MAG: 30S ribosomal protein S1, partial [Arcobacteraceae bacterium]|nr:30S ribosomal protein S1 [Arcobacteraceae bacterium]